MNQTDVKQTADLLRQGLQNGRYATLTVTSNSMAPLIQKGDEVCIVATAASRLQPGDIITMETPSGLLTHRFWRLAAGGSEQRLYTRGSKPVAFDPPYAATTLVGRVFARQRHGKQLNLDSGWGGWLNRRLRQWNAWENRLIVGAPAASMKRSFWRRVVKQSLYVWAVVLTAVINHIAAKPVPTENL